MSGAVAWALGALGLVLGQAFCARRARARRARLFARPPSPARGAARRLGRALCAGAFAAAVGLLAALAARALEAGARPLSGRAADLVVCLDVSRSMLATDESPSRLGRARAWIRAALATEPRLRAALVVFAGEARLAAPLTSDAEGFGLLLERAGPASVSLGGTDLGAALEGAGAAFVAEADRPRRVLLVTDGEDHAGRGHAAAQALRARGVRVDVLAVGSERGSRIPAVTGPDPFLRDRAGREVLSRVDRAGLAALARGGGGRLFGPADEPARLGLALPATPAGAGDAGDTALGLLAFALLAVGLLRGGGAWPALLLGPLLLGACGARRTDDGFEAFAAGRPTEARARFERALAAAPAAAAPTLAFNAALSAWHALGDGEPPPAELEAIAALLARVGPESGAALRARAATLRGAVALRRSAAHARAARAGAGDPAEHMQALRHAEDALAALQAAARGAPADPAAWRNVERALRWIGTLRERRSVRPRVPRPRPGTPEVAPPADPPPEPPPAAPGRAAGTPDLDPAELDRLREILAQKAREREALRERRRAERSTAVERDW